MMFSAGRIKSRTSSFSWSYPQVCTAFILHSQSASQKQIKTVSLFLYKRKSGARLIWVLSGRNFLRGMGAAVDIVHDLCCAIFFYTWRSTAVMFPV
jgi:hypothetical protein